MATCSTATLIEQACDNGFMAASTDVQLYRALKHQLLCNIFAGGGGGGATAFTGLTDTFASYAGRALEVLRVNAGQTGIESVSLSASTVTKNVPANVALDGVTTQYTIPHGIAAVPAQLNVVLVCTANDAGSGLSAGMESNLNNWVNASAVQPAFQVTRDSTNVYVSLCDGNGLVGNEGSYVVNQLNGTGIGNPSSFNNFAFKIYAWI